MYETQIRGFISRLAKADLKSRKMGNRFIMITIILAASLLMVMGLFPRTIKVEQQRLLAAAQDVIYHEVTKAQIKALEKDSRISYMTLDKAGEQMEVDDYIIQQVYYDASSKTIKTLTVTEGQVPKKQNEVVVSKAYIKKLGKEPKLGMKITVPFLSGEQEVCVVSGFSEKVKNSNIYPILRSKAYAEHGRGMKDIRYDVLAKIQDSSKMKQEEFLAVIRDAAKQAGIPRVSVNENNHYVDTLPKSGISSDTVVIAVIGMIILIAGIMVIYSVFYISVTGKTRQYGQLRTLGMTKKQVRELVRREGMVLALRAAPIGILLGAAVSWGIKPGGFSIVNTLFMALIVAVVILLTVLVSIMKPAKLAAAVSPIEAAKYTAYTGNIGRKSTKKLQRKITPMALARMNNSRNRKKAFVTMLSLGLGGVLFIGAITFAVSWDKEKYTRVGEFQFGEFVICYSGNAAQTAKNGRAQLQADNPLTKELRQEIEAIPGVKKVYSMEEVFVQYDYADQSGQSDSITPFSRQDLKALEEKKLEGNINYEELLKGDKILIKGNDVAEEIFGWRFEPGENVVIRYFDGKKWNSRTYEIAGVVESFQVAVTDGWFILPRQVLKDELPGVDLTSSWIVSTEDNMREQVEAQLSQILDQNPKLSVETLREAEERTADTVNQTLMVILAITLFITLFSMLNLINTLITNFLSQKTELAMLQSIGMTGSQLSKMVIGEGLVLAAGNILISLIFGSLLGYGVCSIMKAAGASYMIYQFPVLFALLYIAVVLLVPCIISMVMMRRFRGQSLVERLREV